mmetsp:Transcript_39212/g.92236  ORF Transcript_39212/g.92236 Transcript_39212/m.92236 type:complete len:235 (+) Transcript_39212:340-1044(+)
MPGWARVKAVSRGISHSAAKPGVVVSASTWRWCGSRTARTATRRVLSAAAQAACRRRPSSVSTRARWRRSNSATPSSASSARICRLMADWVTKRSAAACVKLRWRAAASKAASSGRGGRWSSGLFGMSWRNAKAAESSFVDLGRRRHYPLQAPRPQAFAAGMHHRRLRSLPCPSPLPRHSPTCCCNVARRPACRWPAPASCAAWRARCGSPWTTTGATSCWSPARASTCRAARA